MQDNIMINFNKFYLIEFFENVQLFSEKYLSEEDFRLIDALMNNLNAQQDIILGLETLAKEQGTSELSIFLFDFIERMADYPPTLVYDSLAEMAEDFVNTAKVMLEEGESRDSIAKVNALLRGDRVEAVIPEDFQSEEKTEGLPEIDQGTEPEKQQIAEEYSYFQFIEKEFDLKLDAYLQAHKQEKTAKFVILIKDAYVNISDTHELKANLARLFFSLSKIFPWRTDLQYHTVQHGQQINESIDGFFMQLTEFVNDNEILVAKSIENNQIEIPDTKVKVLLKREEVPEKPITIDALLSEYFQSDVNDYIEKFDKALEDLKHHTTDRDQIREFLELLKSFKEICMIHGYTHLEDLSTDISTLIKEKQRKRRYMSDASLSLLTDLLELLKNAEKLRSDIEETSERAQLKTWVTGFAKTFEKKNKLAAVESPAAEMAEKEELAITDKEKMGEIILDLIIESFPQIKKYIKKGDFDQAKIFVRKYINAARLCSLMSLFDLLTNIIEAIDSCETVTGIEQKEKIKQFINTYTEFVEEFTLEGDTSNWVSRWEALCIVPGYTQEILIPASNTNRLLEIVLEIEDVNLPGFGQRLYSVFYEDNHDSRRALEIHFKRLKQNAAILGLEDLGRFSELYGALCRTETGFVPDETQIEELSNLYMTCIQRFKEKGIQADIADIISGYYVLSEKEGVPEEEPEEDLLAIFKEEGINYLNIIDKALDTLTKNNKDRGQYEIIEKNIHSLKSSARLMGFTDVVDLSAPIEKKCEEFNTKKMVAEKDALPLFKEIVEGIRQLVLGKEVDTEVFQQKLAEIRGIELEVNDTEFIVEALEKTHEEKKEEKPLFSEPADEDGDMLVIFKEEASEYIKTIDGANIELKEKPENNEALHKQEYASHSLKSAAMMLGFREIGQIANAIEQVTEAINKGDLKNNLDINEKINKAIEIVKSMTEGSKIEPDGIADMLNALDIGQLKQVYKATQERVDEDKTVEIGSMSALFLKESWEFLGKINRDLVNLEKKPEDTALIDEINRTVHTLKGSAQMMHFDKIGTIAHKIEEYLEGLKKNPEHKIDPVFEGLDEIQRLMLNIKSGKGEESDSYPEALEKLSFTRESHETKSVMKPGVIQEDKNDNEEQNEHAVHVRTGHLDSMINMAADLIVNKTKLSNHLDELKVISEQIEKERKVLKTNPKALPDLSDGKHVTDEQVLLQKIKDMDTDYQTILKTYDSVSSKFTQITQDLEENLSQISILTKHLHDDILKTRMVPVESLFNRFPRAVRDMAHKQNKKVTLIVEGEDTELDRALVESLSDPVMHLLRNAIDHGIELPEERIKNNKTEDGILLLRAKQERNQILIEVQDDGRGLNMDKIKQVIIARKLATPVEVSEKGTNELIGYIFTPGFSTLENASAMSGRGIGLDVVLSEVRKLKGDIRVNVTPGKGTTFSIRVPLSLLILQALLFEVGGETLAIPLASVQESVFFEAKKIENRDNTLFYKVDKRDIQVMDLAQLLNIEKAKDTKQNIILLEEAGSKFGIIVDKVVGRQDIVVKSIGDQLNNLPYISGGTILGDGSVCLILDILALSRNASESGFSADHDISYLEKARKLIEQKADDSQSPDKTETKKSALIVDDSISVRKFVSAVLSRNNFNTTLASNGDEALKELKKGHFDLVLTDLEMPKVDGFEFIEQLRNMDRYKDVPVIILSGRASHKHQERGQKLGANAFIIKPFKEPDLLDTIKKFINQE